MPYYHSGAVRLYYEERPGAGTPNRTIVFVHGWCDSALSWRSLIAGLPPHSAAFAPDLRGTGNSDHPKDGYTIEQYAADVFALFEEQDLRNVDLVGHSMGGAVALQLALDHPDRLRSLILISPVPPDGLPHGGPDSLETRQAARTDREAARRLVRSYYVRPIPEAAVEQGAEALLTVSDGHYWDSLDAMESLRLGARLGELTMPVLIMTGDSDRVIPLEVPFGMWLAIPDCGLQVFWRVGHSPRLEVPDAFRSVLLDFLDALA